MEDRKGGVCEKHGEFSPTGICRWCEVKASSPPATGSVPAPKEPSHWPGTLLAGSAEWLKERYATVHLPTQAPPTVMGFPIIEDPRVPPGVAVLGYPLPAPTCTMWRQDGATGRYSGRCGRPAIMRRVSPFAIEPVEWCAEHIRMHGSGFGDWERIAPVASEGPKASDIYFHRNGSEKP